MDDGKVEGLVAKVLSPDNNHGDPFYKILVWAILRGFVKGGGRVRVQPDSMPG